jgi:hypothetical protein
MATYNVVSGKSQTLAGSTVDIVNLSRAADRVLIANTAATNAIYANVAGPALPAYQTGPAVAAPTPTVGGDNSMVVILPNSSQIFPPVGRSMIGTIALISSGAQTYTITSIP